MINKTNNIHFTPQYKYNPSFMAYEKTFVMLKPDSFERKLDMVIINEIQKKGLKVLKSWEGMPAREKLEGNYEQYKNRSFFTDWIDFLQSGKIKAMIVGGEDAISEVNMLKFSLRDKYAQGERRINLLHASDDTDCAKKECKNFFDIEI